MDDILRRLGNVESDVSELRAEVSAISAAIPHLATAASVSEIQAVMPHLATKADLTAEIGGLRTEVMTAVGKVETKVAAMEAAIIKWIVATGLTTGGLTAGVAFSIAKFVH